MSFLDRELRGHVGRWELPAVCILALLVFFSIPLLVGEMGLSWDTLNHHIYLGWTAEGHRLDQDVVAAGFQSFQFPYVYWPAYRLAVGGFSGEWAGAVLAIPYVLAVPPVWMLARACLPGITIYDAIMRLMAVTLGFTSCLVLAHFGSTSNDLLVSIPFVWALAFAFEPWRPGASACLKTRHAMGLSGFLLGVSVAFKLSNIPLGLLLPMLWVLPGKGVLDRLVTACWAALACVAGFVLTYGYWGAQLWQRFGNPIFPLFDHQFAPLRSALGWAP